jgi:hypothetical protein
MNILHMGESSPHQGALISTAGEEIYPFYLRLRSTAGAPFPAWQRSRYKGRALVSIIGKERITIFRS